MRQYLIKELQPVGSRITCNPPPTDTDEDFLILVDPDDFHEFVFSLTEDGFDLGGSDIFAAEEVQLEQWEGFQSYKKGITNYIVTASEDFFNKFMRATEFCKKFNELNKGVRIAVFQFYLYGNLNFTVS